MIEPILRRVPGPAGELAVWDHPGGPDQALLLHGIGNYGRAWDDVAEAMAGRLRLIAPDARGHGDSPKPQEHSPENSPEGYAPSDFAADAEAILNGFGLDQVILVGHSMGGGHALIFALTHPARVQRLVIVDVGLRTLPEGRERAIRLSTQRPESFADAAEAERYLRATSPGYTDHVYADRMRWLFRPTADGRLAWRSDARSLAAIFTSGRGRMTETASRLGELRMPVLVVRGTHSSVLGAEDARDLVARLPNARLLELDAGHNVQLDRPAELAEAILSG